MFQLMNASNVGGSDGNYAAVSSCFSPDTLTVFIP